MGIKRRYRNYCIAVLGFTLVPWAAVCLFNFVIDPFNFNRVFDLKLIKQGPQTDERLFKLVEYMHAPKENILLGDSRMNNLSLKRIRRASGLDYYNFAYGGGSAYEIIDTFWYAVSRCRLKNVYIGMGFNLWNSFNDTNHVADARARIDHQDRYYSSFFIARLSYRDLQTSLRARSLAKTKPKNGPQPAGAGQASSDLGSVKHDSGTAGLDGERGGDSHQGIRPNMTKDQFWDVQLNQQTAMFYSRYRYPDDIAAGLSKVKQYCDRHRINLVFVIVPTHADLQHRVVDYNLVEQYTRFKQALAAIAPTIDYDYPNQWTINRDLFDDPYHSIDSIGNALVDEVWGNDLKVGKR